VMFNCQKHGFAMERGRARRPGCADRMAFQVRFLVLAAVLLSSVLIGLRDLNTRARLESVIAEPPPVARAKAVQLVSEPSNHARERIRSDTHRKAEEVADELIQLSQQR
jgi:hypothetical protein